MEHRRIIKKGPVTLATREDGSMDPASASSQGLFLADTRFLSRFQVRLNEVEPLLLGSSEEILFESSYLRTNPPLGNIPAHGIGLLQRNTIEEGMVRIQLTVSNWTLLPLEFELSIEVDADFFDSFEARGVRRLQRGELEDPFATERTIELRYLGLDDVTRITHISVDPPMTRFDDGWMYWAMTLEVAERKELELQITMVEEAPDGAYPVPRAAMAQASKPPWFDDATTISVSSGAAQAIVRRSLDDLQVLLTEYEGVWVPMAGLPRFAVPFGRDCCITGLETLLWNHQLAREALLFLARTQGREENPWNHEAPGKIMHEMHTGELARLNEVPFGLFYGSVDSTLLFLVLGGEYLRWSGDLAFYRQLKPNFEAAWQWINQYGDLDDSGYVQYRATTPPRMSTAALTVGLFNQGWKDSAIAVAYADGTLCLDHPVALAEVQGYLYRALYLWGDLYCSMPESEGMRQEGEKLKARAQRLKEQFNREFWMPEKQYYAMALDGHHRQVDSITSNPGHCLWSRLIDQDKAEAVVKKLLDPSMFTAWGIRTMASTERAYNPFSYHVGSVWPFENALICSGIKKYAMTDEVQKVFDALIEASFYFEYRRWPEVYCGVGRERGGVLARQPDASRPQAWSAGAIFLLLQTLLGIAPLPFSRRIDITPHLPTSVDEIVAENLFIAGGRLSLRLVRQHHSVLLEIIDNPDDLDIVIHPAGRRQRALTEAPVPAISVSP